jgi:hypothetical protein
MIQDDSSIFWNIETGCLHIRLAALLVSFLGGKSNKTNIFEQTSWLAYF